MTKHWLAGAAAFAMMTGVAFAQSVSTESSSTQSKTITTAPAPVPAVGTFNSYETRQNTDTNGTATDTSKTFESGPAGSKATSNSRIMSRDGSEQTTSHDTRTDVPGVGTTINKSSTTTKIDH